jgi:hypothetical protein
MFVFLWHIISVFNAGASVEAATGDIDKPMSVRFGKLLHLAVTRYPIPNIR